MRRFLITVVLLALPAAASAQDTRPAPFSRAEAECSWLQSSKICDALGFKTAEKRKAPAGSTIRGRQ